MKSMMRTEPPSHAIVVSSTRVSPRYRRPVVRHGGDGRSVHFPWSSVPTSAARHASESNRGAQSQSTAPSSPTSAEVCKSPIIAYCSILSAMAFSSRWHRGHVHATFLGETPRLLGAEVHVRVCAVDGASCVAL